MAVPRSTACDKPFVASWSPPGMVVSGLDASEQGHPARLYLLLEAVVVAAVKAIPKGARTA
jgi:hypothetical protein